MSHSSVSPRLPQGSGAASLLNRLAKPSQDDLVVLSQSTSFPDYSKGLQALLGPVNKLCTTALDIPWLVTGQSPPPMQ